MRIFLLVIFFLVTGCALQKWYYNENVKPDEQQMFYEQDQKYCKGVAEGLLPMPDVNLSQNQQYRTYGTATMYSQSTGYVDVRYESLTVPVNGYASGFQQGFQISNAFFTALNRTDFADSCMFRLGWREIPCETCIPNTSPSKAEVEQLFQKYINQPANKAFAKASNGFAGAVWGVSTEERAKMHAIRICTESGGKDCHIVNVNGVSE